MGVYLRLGKKVIKNTIKGCAWCNRTDGYDRFECCLINNDGNTLVTRDHMVVSCVADYCPVCGRRLESEDK